MCRTFDTLCALQSVHCNLCIAICALQSVPCNLCRAILFIPTREKQVKDKCKQTQVTRYRQRWALA